MLRELNGLEHLLRERFGSFGAFRYFLQVRVRHAQLAAARAVGRFFGRENLTFGSPLSVDDDPLSFPNFTLLHSAEDILLGDPARDTFLQICQFVYDGRIFRGNIFVCEVPAAKFFPQIGLVFTADWQPVVESILDRERLANFKRLLRPRKTTKRQGVYSSVTHLWHFRNWHWMADCMPQVYSLARYMKGQPLTLLMPSDLGQTERRSLDCILPPNFEIEYVDPNEWFEIETFILPSHVSSRANAFLPPEYYEFIRSNTLKSLNIVRPSRPTGRYYLSRSGARHRRILNEPKVVELLEAFGFESVLIENYSFIHQVELFSNAELIVSPHSAALGSIMYGKGIQLCVLYPEAHPATYFYTLARGLQHEHFYLAGNQGENDDFSVDLVALRRLLVEEMQIREVGAGQIDDMPTSAVADLEQLRS